MVEIIFDKNFREYYNMRIFRSLMLSNRFTERVKMFSKNPHNPILNDHSLQGNLINCRAFSITSDIRVIYTIVDDQVVRFVNIGTHEQVYGK